MKMRQLQTFCAIMSKGTMTAAAQHLGTSQPGVSSLIAALEKSIGFQLFVRRRGRLIATPEAEQFFRIVDPIVASLDTAKTAASQLAQGKRGELRVAGMPGFGLTVIPAVVATLRNERPEARFRILTRSTEAVRLLIPLEQCDVALVEAPIDRYSSQTEVLTFECVAMVRNDNPLAKHDMITPDLIEDENIVALFPEHPTYQQLQRAFTINQVAFSPVVEARVFATCCEIVRQSGGITIVDPMTAKAFAHDTLVARPFEPSVFLDVAVVLPGDGPYSTLAIEFVERLKSHLTPFLSDTMAV